MPRLNWRFVGGRGRRDAGLRRVGIETGRKGALGVVELLSGVLYKTRRGWASVDRTVNRAVVSVVDGEGISGDAQTLHGAGGSLCACLVDPG